jgi:HTH-type transcriptional regulator / antitoxin MqsA
LLNEGEANMFRCQVCGATEAHQESVNEVFLINGKYVLVEGIPASICARCGEATFSRETTERIRRMVHGEAQPVRAVAMEVFAYA